MIPHLILLVTIFFNHILRYEYTPSKTSNHYNGPYNNVKLNDSKNTSWEQNGVLTHHNTPATGLINQVSQIQINPKMTTAPLISVEVLCDYGCTITLDKQEMSVQ